jgi:hypothetical protein
MDDRFDKYMGLKTIPVDKMGFRGWANFKHFNANSEIIGELTTPNTVVNTGLAQVAGLLNGQVTTGFTAIAIGTGTTAVAAANTALVAEVGRGSATCTRQQTTVTNDTAQDVATFSFNGSTAITESGIFDAGAAGTMCTRATFAAINVSSGDSLQITISECLKRLFGMI